MNLFSDCEKLVLGIHSEPLSHSQVWDKGILLKSLLEIQ